ncbi:MAG: hypothetical protein JO197_21250 [Acidobacteria bacterium]|nr:hypothetical protein [Acidobacteriota bacterium]MBV9476901.1 hypothetical protein [Acidobacteriota bacterium]
MTRAVRLTAFLSLLLAFPLHASCNLGLRVENGVLHWNAVTGATEYWIVESLGNSELLRNYTTRQNTFTIAHRSSSDGHAHYVVTAIIRAGVQSADTDNSLDACTGAIDVELPADAAFRALTRRAVLPVVGSTAGAFGGKFKTALTLVPTAANQRGRIVFHPAGVAGSANDPSMPFAFTNAQPLVFDDVVATMGQSGLGSIDIVPDEGAQTILPRIEARLYNDTSLGTFGTFAEAIYPYDYLEPPSMHVPIADERFRVNVGFRTLTDVTMSVFVYAADGRLLALETGTFPADWMQMTSASDLAKRALAPGMWLEVAFGGAVIPFYTVTENRTNDPTLVVAPAQRRSADVGNYIQ